MANLFKNLDKKDIRISFRISPSIEKAIKTTAKKNNIATTKVIHACVNEGLKHLKDIKKTRNTSTLKETITVISISQEFLERINAASKKINITHSELLRRTLAYGLNLVRKDTK